MNGIWHNKLYIHVLLNSNNIESRTVISRMARKDGGRGELAVQQLYFLQNWKRGYSLLQEICKANL